MDDLEATIKRLEAFTPPATWKRRSLWPLERAIVYMEVRSVRALRSRSLHTKGDSQ